MKIEALERFLDGTNVYEKGDVRTVPDEDGAYFVRNGWAKDVEGKVDTGERDISHVKLDTRKSLHAVAADKVEG